MKLSKPLDVTQAGVAKKDSLSHQELLTSNTICPLSSSVVSKELNCAEIQSEPRLSNISHGGALRDLSHILS